MGHAELGMETKCCIGRTRLDRQPDCQEVYPEMSPRVSNQPKSSPSIPHCCHHQRLGQRHAASGHELL
jgi:hypothetical protein